MADFGFLELPKRIYLKSEACGHKKVFSEYVGFKYIPSFLFGEVPHGWIIKERNIIADFVIGSDGLGYQRKNKRLYVARYDQEEFLKSEGFTNVYAIGHPIIYLRKPNVKRCKNSLLIMPPHSLDDSTENWDLLDFKYAEYLKPIIKDFEYVALCIHPTDVKKGNWRALCSLIPNLIEGAHMDDSNSYLRMAILFSFFEFVTTNSFGSHIAYASYFGSNVSICGPYPKWDRESVQNLTFYKNSPELLDILEEWHDGEYFKKWYNDFFVNHPKEGISKIEWAAFQLGEDCKVDPSAIKKLFRWNYYGITRHYLGRLKRYFYKSTSIIVTCVNFIKFFGPRGIITFYKVKRSKLIGEGITKFKLNKTDFLIRNGSTDIDVLMQHIGRRELLDLEYPKKTKVILDLGSNIGISIQIFHKMFPKAYIYGVEMNEENFHVLYENSKNNSQIKILQGAVWSKDCELSEMDSGIGEWGIRVVESSFKENNSVIGYSIERIFEIFNISKVDILKVDIEGAEVEVFQYSWPFILEKSKMVIVEVHNWIPNIQKSFEKILDEISNHFDIEISYSGEFTIISNKGINTFKY